MSVTVKVKKLCKKVKDCLESNNTFENTYSVREVFPTVEFKDSLSTVKINLAFIRFTENGSAFNVHKTITASSFNNFTSEELTTLEAVCIKEFS